MCNSRDNVIEAFQNGGFPLKDGFKKKESDMSDKALPNWVKVDKKRFNRIKTKSKMLKIIIYMVSQIAVVLLVLTSHTD